MLDIKFIRENADLIKKTATEKFVTIDVDRLLELEEKIRITLQEVDQMRSERNKVSSQIPSLSSDEKKVKIEYVRELKDKISKIEDEIKPLQDELDDLLLRVPNPTIDEVPVGESDEDNVEIRKVGEIPTFDFEIKDHMDLAEDLDLVDMPRGAKVAGSRSYYLKNQAVLLEMALTRFVIDKLVSKGFTPFTVPLMVRPEAMKGTGYFPLGIEQAYHMEEDELYLVGTSEVSLVSYNSGEVLNKEELPKMYAGFSPCFRREAGTYGKDTRGLYRVHQFTKIEQVIMCEANDETQYKLHNFLLNNAEEILQDLKIPYRVVQVCTGDIGLGQVRKHDIEAWMPSRGKYSETHSCSSFRDFQARRSNIKYRDENGELKYVYTLNNTAIASPRVLIPILEIYQNADGSITVPDVLVPYMGGMTKIEKKNK